MCGEPVVSPGQQPYFSPIAAREAGACTRDTSLYYSKVTADFTILSCAVLEYLTAPLPEGIHSNELEVNQAIRKTTTRAFLIPFFVYLTTPPFYTFR